MTDRRMLYGLVVESEIDLHQDREAPPAGPPDVVVVRGDDVATLEPPDGRVLIRLGDDDAPLYTMVESPDGGYLLRFFHACDVAVSADLSRMTVSRHVDAVPGLEAVLTTGAALAFQLYARGLLVLHASAVQVGDASVGFVGRSGMGKSTMAALLCSEGAGSLITDDVLRVDVHDGEHVSRLGATELRLRKGADELSSRFATGTPNRRTSADARQILAPGAGARDRAPLAALVVPLPDRETHELRLEPLTGKDALLTLLSYPRLVGVVDPAISTAQLALTAALVRDVPVVAAHVPWGPPFAPDLGSRLAEGLEAITGRPLGQPAPARAGAAASLA
ncbi:hypothetical protein LEP48_05820 [Isoptericola sp. NEAU-Y5]|uniref:HPr kinase n=1 Tax=Isoptericola luteus TaxID=2879484 RepID=A0ABS7ZEJ1_9MICO|nr:hypothetical protein [Isoptericola sp. NEAU-Y5]MCA5892872.1 hypothetical protein [Isoptericola sp. NEAU-Y5]